LTKGWAAYNLLDLVLPDVVSEGLVLLGHLVSCVVVVVVRGGKLEMKEREPRVKSER